MTVAMLLYLYLMRYTLVAYPIQAVLASNESMVVRLRKQYRRTRSACAPHCGIDMPKIDSGSPNYCVHRRLASPRTSMYLTTFMFLPDGVH